MKKVLMMLVSLAWLAGCVQTTPVAGIAPAGDVVVLGLGGIERNAGGNPALKPADLAVTLTDANNTVHNLEAKYVFKSYPSHASFLNTATHNGFVGTAGLSNMVAYDGGWFAMVRLMYPGTDTPINTSELATCPATMSVVSAKLRNLNNGPEGNLLSLPIEILPGSTPFNQNYERQFIAYQHGGNSFVVAPDDLSGINEVGGAFVVLDYNDDTVFGNGLEPMVVLSDHNPFVQLSYNVVSNGDGSGKVYVTLLNPAGFSNEASAGPNARRLSNLSSQLMYYIEDVTVAKANFSVDTASSYYIGVDGSVLSGLAPQLTHYDDL